MVDLTTIDAWSIEKTLMKVLFRQTLPIVTAMVLLSGFFGNTASDNVSSHNPPMASEIAPRSTPGSVIKSQSSDSPIFVATVPPGEEVTRDDPVGPVSTSPTRTVEESAFDSDGDGWLTYEEFERAVGLVLPDYEFPDDYQTSVPFIMQQWDAFRDGGAEWQVGLEDTTLNMYHMCAWELTWLDAYSNTDEDLMQESLDQLRTVPLQAPNLQGIKDSMSERFDRAELGDPTLVQQHVDSSCLMEWATPEAGTPAASIITQQRFGDFADQSIAENRE